MKIKLVLATSATFGFLLISGCNQAPDTTAANSAAENEARADNAAIEAADSNAAEPLETTASQSTTVIEQPVRVVEVPAPAPSAPPAAAAPLTAAASVARRIRDGRDIVQIPYQGGWAWRENGRIVRTSSSDGRRVSYFRPGEDQPYFVQDGDRGYAYSGNRVERGYDARGNPIAVDPSRRQRGEELAREAAQDRSRANRNDSDQRRQPGATDQHRDDASRQGPTQGNRTDRDRSPSDDRNNDWRRSVEPTVAGNSASSAEPSNSAAPADGRRRPNDRPNN